MTRTETKYAEQVEIEKLGFRVDLNQQTREWCLLHDRFSMSVYCMSLAQLLEIARAMTILWAMEAKILG